MVWARNAILSQLAGEDVKTDKRMDFNFNKDGTFNVADVVMLQSFVLGKIKSSSLKSFEILRFDEFKSLFAEYAGLFYGMGSQM